MTTNSLQLIRFSISKDFPALRFVQGQYSLHL